MTETVRRKIIELTSIQIDKMWPLFQALSDANKSGDRGRAIIGQAYVQDEGRVTGRISFRLISAKQAKAIDEILKKKAGQA